MIWTLLLFAIAGLALAPENRNKLPSTGAMLAVGMALYAFALSLHPRANVAALAGLAAVGVFTKLLYSRRLPPLRFRLSLPPAGPRRLVLLLLLLWNILGVFALVRFAGIPVMNYDVLSYHIPLAQEFAEPVRAQALLDSPSIFYARMPLGAPAIEAPFVQGNDGASGMGLHLLLAIAMLAGANSAARCAAWLGARRAGRLAASGLYLFHPLLLGAYQSALVEPLLALMAVAGLEFVLIAGSRAKWNSAGPILAGVLSGAAMAIKFSAAGTAVLPLALVATLFGLKHGLRRFCWMFPLLFGVGFLIVMTPWLSRAVGLGGHPLYPFKGASPDWTHAQAEFVVAVHRPQSVLSLTYWSDVFTRNNAFGYAPGAVPVSMLLMVAAGSFFMRSRRTMVPVFCAALVGYLFFLTVQGNPSRFLTPPAVLLIPLAARVTASRRGSPTPHLAKALLAAGALFQVVPAVRDALLYQPMYRADDRRAYVEDQLAAGMTDAAASAAAGGTLLLLFEARAALFAGPVEYNTVWDQPPWAEMLRSSSDGADFAHQLAQSGVSAVYVNEAEFGRLLDFYAKDRLSTTRQLWQNVGVLGTPRGEWIEMLGAYPPHRFAGFTQRDLTILADFLLTQRRRAVAWAPQGPVSEVWVAKVTSE